MDFQQLVVFVTLDSGGHASRHPETPVTILDCDTIGQVCEIERRPSFLPYTPQSGILTSGLPSFGGIFLASGLLAHCELLILSPSGEGKVPGRALPLDSVQPAPVRRRSRSVISESFSTFLQYYPGSCCSRVRSGAAYGRARATIAARLRRDDARGTRRLAPSQHRQTLRGRLNEMTSDFDPFHSLSIRRY